MHFKAQGGSSKAPGLKLTNTRHYTHRPREGKTRLSWRLLWIFEEVVKFFAR
jgi:hypothetical protein